MPGWNLTGKHRIFDSFNVHKRDISTIFKFSLISHTYDMVHTKC